MALTNLLKKNAPFIWTQEHQRKFDSLKKAVANAAILRYPDPNLKYSVYCDACDYGITAVLCQSKEEGKHDEPVCFISRKLKSAEINYATMEK